MLQNILFLNYLNSILKIIYIPFLLYYDNLEFYEDKFCPLDPIDDYNIVSNNILILTYE